MAVQSLYGNDRRNNMTITRAQKERKAKIKKAVLWIVLSAFIMIALPFLAVKLVNSFAGMGVSLLLFFAVNPLYSAISGYFAGKDVKTFWWISIVNVLLYIAGVWIFFDTGETAFFIYASVYLVLGLAAMIITALVKKSREDKKNAIKEARKLRKGS